MELEAELSNKNKKKAMALVSGTTGGTSPPAKGTEAKNKVSTSMKKSFPYKTKPQPHSTSSLSSQQNQRRPSTETKNLNVPGKSSKTQFRPESPPYEPTSPDFPHGYSQHEEEVTLS